MSHGLQAEYPGQNPVSTKVNRKLPTEMNGIRISPVHTLVSSGVIK